MKGCQIRVEAAHPKVVQYRIFHLGDPSADGLTQIGVPGEHGYWYRRSCAPALPEIVDLIMAESQAQAFRQARTGEETRRARRSSIGSRPTWSV